MEKEIWPDEVRLKMIENSKFYPDDERVYQYGFYDGYQYLKTENKVDTYYLRELLNDLNYNIETNLQNGIDNIHITYLKNIWNKLSDEITKMEEL